MTQIINSIIAIFESFRMTPTVIDQYEAIGRANLFKQIERFVIVNSPVKFSMLGYPMKSTNTRDKVIGQLPDLGEKKSLENFGHFANLIKEVYSPGIEITLISDGYIFSDILGISDNIVRDYHEVVKDMASSMPITVHDARHFYDRNMSIDQVREKVIFQFGISPEVLEKRILLDPNVNALYRGMMFFMTEEIALQSFPSRNQMQKKAKSMAREMMFRNEAYSALVRTVFSDHIRLSMHNTTNDGTKYSFQLVPGKYLYSPWHSALVVHADGVLETVHKKDAEEKGYALVSVDGQPFYYEEQI